MHEVIIALGSNTNAATTIKSAIAALADIITNIQPTQLLENESVDFIFPCTFANALVKGLTTLSADQLETELKILEKRFGRTKDNDQKGCILLDLDLLMYDKQKHHINDWNREYIQLLIKELNET